MFIGSILIDDKTKCAVPRTEDTAARYRQKISESDEVLAWAISADTRERCNG
jgi:hypothetical protein